MFNLHMSEQVAYIPCSLSAPNLPEKRPKETSGLHGKELWKNQIGLWLLKMVVGCSRETLAWEKGWERW